MLILMGKGCSQWEAYKVWDNAAVWARRDSVATTRLPQMPMSTLLAYIQAILHTCSEIFSIHSLLAKLSQWGRRADRRITLLVLLQ